MDKWPLTFEYLSELHLDMLSIWSGKHDTYGTQDILHDMNMSIWTSTDSPPWNPVWGDIIPYETLFNAHKLIKYKGIVPQTLDAIAVISLKSEHINHVRDLISMMTEDLMEPNIPDVCEEYEDELPGNPYVYPGHLHCDIIDALNVTERELNMRNIRGPILDAIDLGGESDDSIIQLDSDESESEDEDDDHHPNVEMCQKGFSIIETSMEEGRQMTEWEYIEISNIFKELCKK